MNEKELNEIAELLEQAPVRIPEFKKETYKASFQKYVEDHSHILHTLSGLWSSDVPQEQDYAQVADCLSEKAQTMLDEVKSRSKKGSMQLNLNLYMVSYFLPAIIAYQRRCGGHEEEMRRLTTAICDSWEARFGMRIQASDHESIQAGFKQKLCFVTTAVCCGLHKPQDCREIALMKRYRDEYLLGTADGEAAVREYYDIAPTIVKRIAREASPEEKYLYLWNTYIRKCIALAERRENEQCRQLYETMMWELKEEYMTTGRKGVLHKNEQTV